MSEEIELKNGYTADPPDKDGEIWVYDDDGFGNLQSIYLTREDLEKMLKLFEDE